jgi:hypothetical protein
VAVFCIALTLLHEWDQLRVVQWGGKCIREAAVYESAQVVATVGCTRLPLEPCAERIDDQIVLPL